MSVTVTIGGTPIAFPTSGQEQNWAPAVVEFAQAVEAALSGVSGAFDVAPQILVIDSYNPGVAIDIPNLAFPTSQVQAARIEIVTYRTTSTSSAYSKHNIDVVYNPDNPVNSKWEIAQDLVGDGLITFSISDVGQVHFTTTAMGGINHVGKLTYLAKAFENS